MELWIRSQDKRILQKIDNMYLNATYDNKRICTLDNSGDSTELGNYKSKERALEVLDDIQSYLSGEWLFKNFENVKVPEIFPIIFFQMPEE